MDADVDRAYTEYYFCRYVWHCRPSEYREERAVDLLRHLAIMTGDANGRAPPEFA